MKTIVIGTKRINAAHILSWEGSTREGISTPFMQTDNMIKVSLEIEYGDSVYPEDFSFTNESSAANMVREIDEFMRGDRTWLDLEKVYNRLQNTDTQVSLDSNVA